MTDSLDSLAKDSILSLSPGVRMKYDEVRECNMLLMPECIVKLNNSASEVLELVDGKRTVAQIYAELAALYEDETLHKDLAEFLTDALVRGWIEIVQA